MQGAASARPACARSTMHRRHAVSHALRSSRTVCIMGQMGVMMGPHMPMLKGGKPAVAQGGEARQRGRAGEHG